MPQYDDQELTAEVIRSFAATPNPRLKLMLTELVKSLHGFVRNTDLSSRNGSTPSIFSPAPARPHADAAGIHPAVGRARRLDAGRCGQPPRAGRRDRNHRARPILCRRAPPMPHGTDISPGIAGEPMFVRSRVTDLEGKPLARAEVDVWHADDDGFYDSQKPTYETQGHRCAPGSSPTTTAVLVPHHPAVQLPDPDRRPGRRADRATKRIRSGPRISISWSARKATRRWSRICSSRATTISTPMPCSASRRN